MGGCVIVSVIGSQIPFIGHNLPIKKSDLLLKKPIPIFYMIVIWLEKAWLVYKSDGLAESCLRLLIKVDLPGWDLHVVQFHHPGGK